MREVTVGPAGRTRWSRLLSLATSGCLASWLCRLVLLCCRRVATHLMRLSLAPTQSLLLDTAYDLQPFYWTVCHPVNEQLWAEQGSGAGKGGGAQQRQMQLWQELLAWEKGNPQRLDGPALSARVALAYDEALTVLMHYPDVSCLPLLGDSRLQQHAICGRTVHVTASMVMCFASVAHVNCAKRASAMLHDNVSSWHRMATAELLTVSCSDAVIG